MKPQEPIRVLFVCLGNICRSPLAEGICRAHLSRAAADHVPFTVDSAGTSGWHAGEPPDPGSVTEAGRRGLDITAQRSRKLTADDVRTFDFLVAMDRSNLEHMAQAGAPRGPRLLLARSFDPESSTFDVPDPYGGGPNGFAEVFDILDRAMPHLIAHMVHHGRRGDEAQGTTKL